MRWVTKETSAGYNSPAFTKHKLILLSDHSDNNINFVYLERKHNQLECEF